MAALPELTQRTALDTLYTDAVYGSPEVDIALRTEQVTLIQTAIRGCKPNTDKLHLADFAITQDAQGWPLEITCPQGQTVPVTPSGKPQRFAGSSPASPVRPALQATTGRCPPQPDNRRRSLRLTFNQADIER